MSSVITLSTGQTETIHGTLTDAEDYILMQYGPTYTAWSALGPDDKMRTLAAAVRYFAQQVWQDDADTFAERDAIAVFEMAEYELAVMISADPSVIGLADQGNNIQSVSASGASVSYFNPTTQGAATFPPIVQRLIGSYLGAARTSGPVSPSGQAGSCVNPMSQCSDLDRGEPY